ncbi:MAG: HD domain-containing protein [Candidatus Eisenbacteria bacterium]|uniref:HD domain-containing protein n=1 Tax=Eiseniibacteriota bacterium TaxID=2212470 RepID=A0A938BMG1_UNCEI|nr:HD domain-containing protein [Candidatus Eisenbacteria bacterium]
MQDLVRFLHEVGHLKRVARTGWWVAGVRDPESVAEHSFRAAWIGYLLASRDGAADPARVVLMCLANDLHEARINDLHKIGQAYLDYPAAETKAFRDQAASVAEGEALLDVHREFQAGETPEARIARDADRLECAFQAIEYIYEGHAPCRSWVENTRPALRTEVGRALFAALIAAEPGVWFREAPRVP